jgi:hypothetical protein
MTLQCIDPGSTDRQAAAAWQGPFSRDLERLAHRAWKRERDTHIRRGRSPATFRWRPPAWLNDAIAAMACNDESLARHILLNRNGGVS